MSETCLVKLHGNVVDDEGRLLVILLLGLLCLLIADKLQEGIQLQGR